jgi:hypothetical protein
VREHCAQAQQFLYSPETQQRSCENGTQSHSALSDEAVVCNFWSMTSVAAQCYEFFGCGCTDTADLDSEKNEFIDNVLLHDVLCVNM